MIEDDRLLNRVVLNLSMLELLVLQNNLALALRHLRNRGCSRPLMLELLEQVTQILLREGALPRKDLKRMQRNEERFGSADVARIYASLR